MNLLTTKKIDQFAYVRGLLAMHDIKNIQIARKVRVSDSAVHRVLHGKSRSKRIMQATADLLGMPFEDVWRKCA